MKRIKNYFKNISINDKTWFIIETIIASLLVIFMITLVIVIIN